MVIPSRHLSNEHLFCLLTRDPLFCVGGDPCVLSVWSRGRQPFELQ